MITTKLEAYLIAALLLLVTAGGGAFYFYHKGRSSELATLEAQSAKLLQAADNKIAALNTSYATAVRTITETKDAQIQLILDARASDLKRLGVLDAYRKAHPVLGGAPGPAPQPAGGPGSIERLEFVASGLASALRSDDASLIACYAERDALTGK